MYFPDITGGLLGTFRQPVGSGLRHAQSPDLVGVVSPRHPAGKGLLSPQSCLFKVIIHELTQYFWMLWLAGWWWEDLVSNSWLNFLIYVRHRNLVCFPSADQDNRLSNSKGLECIAGTQVSLSTQIWRIMGRTGSSSIERVLFRLVSIDLLYFVSKW